MEPALQNSVMTALMLLVTGVCVGSQLAEEHGD